MQSFKAWKANAVRVGLNEDCWLGINGVKAAYSGQNYISNMTSYVNMFTNEGFVVIIELHWSAPGSNKATGQQPMPDEDHSIDLWRSVARQFSGNDKVILELFNEPYPDNNNWNSEQGWKCWRDGGKCNGVGYQVHIHTHTCTYMYMYIHVYVHVHSALGTYMYVQCTTSIIFEVCIEMT